MKERSSFKQTERDARLSQRDCKHLKKNMEGTQTSTQSRGFWEEGLLLFCLGQQDKELFTTAKERERIERARVTCAGLMKYVTKYDFITSSSHFVPTSSVLTPPELNLF